MEYIENKIFSEIQVGDTATIVKQLEQRDLELFAIVSGDINPTLLDDEYVKTDLFQKKVAHGMWGGALISSLLGTKLPGPGTIYLGQTLKFLHPIGIGDIITTTIKVVKKNESKPILELECLCTNQDGVVAISGNATVLAPTEKVNRQAIELPLVSMHPKVGSWYKQLLSAKNDFKPLKTAIVHPTDETSLLGAIEAAEEGFIEPIFIGPEHKIREVATKLKIDLSKYCIMDALHSHNAAEKAVELAKTGQIEALMKGNLHTDELMSAIIDKHTGLLTERRVSHIFAIDAPNYPKPLFITDAAININPTLADKVDIVQNAIDFFRCLGLGTPKVAIVSAVETISVKMPSTLDAAALCKMAERKQITGGILDGPLGFDSAISFESAKIKGVDSPVAGQADIIVVPNLEVGNMLYKQLTYLSNIEAAGIVLGASVPLILTSRGSDAFSRKVSCALALVYMRNRLAEKAKSLLSI